MQTLLFKPALNSLTCKPLCKPLVPYLCLSRCVLNTVREVIIWYPVEFVSLLTLKDISVQWVRQYQPNIKKTKQNRITAQHKSYSFICTSATKYFILKQNMTYHQEKPFLASTVVVGHQVCTPYGSGTLLFKDTVYPLGLLPPLIFYRTKLWRLARPLTDFLPLI